MKVVYKTVEKEMHDVFVCTHYSYKRLTVTMTLSIAKRTHLLYFSLSPPTLYYMHTYQVIENSVPPGCLNNDNLNSLAARNLTGIFCWILKSHSTISKSSCFLVMAFFTSPIITSEKISEFLRDVKISRVCHD